MHVISKWLVRLKDVARKPRRGNRIADDGGPTRVRLAGVTLALCAAAGYSPSAQATTWYAEWQGSIETGVQYFSSAHAACEYEWEYFSPTTTLLAETPTFVWNAEQCQWTTYLGDPDPGETGLMCVDQYGNPAPATVHLIQIGDGGSGVCVEDPPVSRDSDNSDQTIVISDPPIPLAGGGGPTCNAYNLGGNVSPTAGDGVELSTGALHQRVTDYRDADGRLTISRTYRSITASPTGSNPTVPIWFGLGDLWRLSFQWDLEVSANFFSDGSFGISTPDGGNYQFTLNTDGSVTGNNNGIQDLSVQFVNPTGSAVNYYSIVATGAQFLVTTSSGDQVLIGMYSPWYVAPYYVVGRAQQITYRGGYVWNFSYGASLGELDSITDSLGRTISFTWNYVATKGTSTSYPMAIQKITMPDGTTLNYGYESYRGTQGDLDSYSRLKSFTRATSGGVVADSASYLYTAPNSPALLTGVVDNAGVQFKTWTYDGFAHVSYAAHPSGADAVSITYSVDPTGEYRYRTVTNALGLQTTYTFVTVSGFDPLITSVVGAPTSTCLGTTTALGYNTNAKISSRTDSLGNVSQYVYGSDGRVQSRTEAYGTTAQRTTGYTWNDTFGVPTQIAEPGLTTNFAYDSTGRVTQRQEVDTTTQSIPYSTNGQTRAWTYGYNSSGLLSSVNGPLSGNQTQYTYSSTGYLTKTTNALGQSTQNSTMNAAGLPLTITDPNGVVTTLTYDADLRLASRQTAGETTSYSYTSTGPLQKVSLPDGSYLQYTYDSARRLTQITDSLGNSVAYTLDAAGNRTAENSHDPTGTLHRTHTRIFTALNQLYQDINAAGSSAVTTTYGYDADGNRGTIAAPLSRETTNGYDALNRLNLIEDPAGGYTHFGYDANDHLISVVDPRSLTTAYVYRGFGDLIGQASPDTGPTVNTYDAAGNVLTSTDARGAVSTYTYDSLDRVASAAFAIAGVTDQTITYTYDSGSNGVGRLTGASDANHSMSWTYDALGRVTGRGMTIGGVNLSVGYGYSSGNRVAMVTPSGHAIAYTYNSNHQISSVAVNGTTILAAATYEPFGDINGWTWGDGSATSRTFNGDGLISQIVTAGVTLGYSFDNANRITAISDSSNSALTWTYGFDVLDRLTSAGTSANSYGWTYDANGNRLTQTGTGATTFTVASGSNQLNSTTGSLSRSYSYDAAGNTSAYGSLGLTYNNRGRMELTTAGPTDYLYNALGQMIEKSGSAGTTIFMQDEAGHLIGEYNASGGLIEETVWLSDIPVATLVPNGTGGINIFYVHTDHLNTPRKIAQPTSGTFAWRWDTDPFGTAAPNNNPAGLGTFIYNLRFPGQYYMAETGLSQNYLRDYDPMAGRYIESDPIGLAGNSYSTYEYCKADPLQYVDPAGLGFINCAAAIARLVAATALVAKRVYDIESLERCGIPPDAGHLKALDQALRALDEAYDIVNDHCGGSAGGLAALTAAAVIIAAATAILVAA
jgi:RHS repeat-associated protein